MQSEDKYDDLTARFAAQDEALQSEAFVRRVMQAAPQRSRWRTPLLFGAGGLGVGAALSQLGGLWDVLKANAPEVTVSVESLPSTGIAWQSVDPVWLAAALMMAVMCAVITIGDRA